MSSKKKAPRLKPTQTLSEAEWLLELKYIDSELTHVLDVFTFLEEIIRLGDESEAAQDVFNATPLFWNVYRDCLQESLFMGLGRLCDSSPNAINVNRVLNRRWPFRDGYASLAGSAAATTAAVPELRLVVSFVRSRHWPYPGGYDPPRVSMSRTLLLLAGFQVILIGRLGDR